MHAWNVRAEGEVVRFPSGRVEAWARFDTFFEEEHERLFKALYFVTGDRQDAEDLMQDAFLRLWERWDDIGRIEAGRQMAIESSSNQPEKNGSMPRQEQIARSPVASAGSKQKCVGFGL